MKSLVITTIAVCMSVTGTRANVTLPAIFGDHMVLQQETEVPIWGWGKSGEMVRIACGWDTTTVYEQKVDNLGSWKVHIRTPPAGGPYSMTIQGYNRIVIDDILVGEVWLCSGQSNMEWTARMGFDNADAEVQAADYPEIRLFTVQCATAKHPQQHLIGQWVKCSPETMIDFSAVGYFFGRSLHDKMDVPVGLVSSAWGGTPAESWMPADTFQQDDYLKTAADRLEEVPWGPTQIARIYNAMIHPLAPFKLAGVIWYQGEANTGLPEAYDETLAALITQWRKGWQDQLPFYFVQIAPYKYDWTRQGALLRDAQRRVNLPGTGMVVVSDIGNIDDIHPGNKKDVGKRLARWALHHDYGYSGMAYSGPLYRSHQVEDGAIRVTFDHTDGGLLCKGEKLTHFEIAGTDRKFYPAEAVIDGATVLVRNDSVPKPEAVRFAMYNTAEPNLFNGAGLPASCFRTDDWEIELERL